MYYITVMVKMYLNNLYRLIQWMTAECSVVARDHEHTLQAVVGAIHVSHPACVCLVMFVCWKGVGCLQIVLQEGQLANAMPKT